MPLPLSSAGRAFVLASLLVLALSACGRRGRLEAPPDPIAVAADQQPPAERERIKGHRGGGSAAIAAPTPGGAQADDDEDEEEVRGPAIAPAPAPRTKTPRRGYTIPKEPFILDPLL